MMKKYPDGTIEADTVEEMVTYEREIGRILGVDATSAAAGANAWQPRLSKRGHPLIWCSGYLPPKAHDNKAPVLTAELYVKWYELYLVHDDGRIATLDFTDLEKQTLSGESAFVDHVPNPRVVERYARVANLTVDPIFLEVAYGRWFLEVKEVAKT